MMVYLRNFPKLLMTFSDLNKLYIKISQLGEMARSMRKEVDICLYKKGHKEDITNCRPISLLSYHKDIYSRVSNRRDFPLINYFVFLPPSPTIQQSPLINVGELC